jgi:predicted enzyme related to lactoylglutathione lyase
MADGDITWFELNVPDVEAAKRFYGAVLPWTFDSPPEFGGYTFINAGGRMIGALNVSSDPAPAGRTVTLYVQVPDLEGALEQARSAGGTVVRERQPVPGDQWYAQFRDPSGLLIGLLTNQPPKTA